MSTIKEKILIFGTGSVSYELYEKMNFNKIDVLAFINSNFKDEFFFDKKVILPEQIGLYEYDYIVIASGYVKKITDILLGVGVKQERIVSYIYDDSSTYIDLQNNMNLYMDKTYNRNKIREWTDGKISEFFPAIFWKNEYAMKKMQKDYVREQSLSLLANQINERNIHGSIAECGVFRGDFTVVIDSVFQNRDFYLFDTFEGFSENDVEGDEAIKNKTGEKNKFKDTSERLVLKRLKNSKNNIIVKKGYFPQTFDLKNQKFVFVSIDFNLYEPVKEALEIFWNSLEKGGIILVSDYSAPFYEGTKVAVDEWCKKNNKIPIPIPDYYGSVLIVKE